MISLFGVAWELLMKMEERFTELHNKTSLDAILQVPHCNSPKGLASFKECFLKNTFIILYYHGWVRTEGNNFSSLLWEMTCFKISVLIIFIRVAFPNKKDLTITVYRLNKLLPKIPLKSHLNDKSNSFKEIWGLSLELWAPLRGYNELSLLSSP